MEMILMQERASTDSVSAMMFIADYGRAAGKACFSLLSQVRRLTSSFIYYHMKEN